MMHVTKSISERIIFNDIVVTCVRAWLGRISSWQMDSFPSIKKKKKIVNQTDRKIKCLT